MQLLALPDGQGGMALSLLGREGGNVGEGLAGGVFVVKLASYDIAGLLARE